MVKKQSENSCRALGWTSRPSNPLRLAAERKVMLSSMLYGLSLPVLGLLFSSSG
jgi:hypothetical protein